MKLNNKRTLLVGFAFFLICAFWQAYDTIVPLMLTNKFGMNQTWSGFIMALDNIFALFMLPLFGALSDKKNTKLGKRTPFILVGTICAVVCFFGLSVTDSIQLQKLSDGNTELFWEQSENYVLTNNEYNSVTNNNVPTTYTLKEYAHQISGKTGEELETWFVGLNKDTVYSYDKETGYKVYAPDEIPTVPTTNAYKSLVIGAESCYAKEITKGSSWVLVLFVILLLGTLISMATFRSPAVALMPDVTVKPLRSKANAIINLMGTVGGLIVLVLGMIFGTGKVENQMMPYMWYIVAICVLMLGALIAFMLTVKERKWNEEMLAEQAKLDAENPEEEVAETVSADEKLPKDKLRSLIFILASVALWFIGYNAITSKYSLYALNVLGKDYNTTLMIAQGAAIVAYIPVGILASKIGRKKSILLGVALLTVSFACASFVKSTSPTFIIWVLFALAGIAWATINVNSFPMVVELSKGGNIGKYTGYYYTASMAAQIVTPILSGFLMDQIGTMTILFPYGAVFAGLSFVTMLFVKHGDSKPETPKDKVEMLAGADD